MTAHEHTLIRVGGEIRCTACRLAVPEPAGMPDYSRAGMASWTTSGVMITR